MDRIATSTVLMVGTVSTSETSVNFYHNTRHNIPESCHHLMIVYRNPAKLLSPAGLHITQQFLTTNMSICYFHYLSS